MATEDLDPRLVQVSIEINGRLKVYPYTGQDGFHIESTGTKYANPLQNEAEIVVFNLTKEDRDYILTECSPFNLNRTPKKIILEAGRVSTGLSKIYEGDISTCIPSQPPDIGLKFKCQTGQFVKGKIVSTQQAASVPLSKIAQLVAGQTGLELNFQATDKQVANYAYTGGALKQVDRLGSVGAVNAYVDDNQLIVKDLNLPLKGQIRLLSADSGMIGIPEVTEFGVKVTYLLDNQTKLGGALQIDSVVYPTVSGKYVIFKLSWSISSYDTPFYWIAETIRHSDSGQAVIPGTVKKQKKGKKRK